MTAAQVRHCLGLWWGGEVEAMVALEVRHCLDL
jgi:hypothetical protein